MTTSNSEPRVGIVVPTTGSRPEYLPQALLSIREAGNAYVILVGKKGVDASKLLSAKLIDEYFDEPGEDVASAINFGIRVMPESVQFVNWLGDDDLLTPGSIDTALVRLDQADSPALVFGGCTYIDHLGREIFTNKSGAWAGLLMRFGPQLIPQPGALFRRNLFEKVGGLNTQYGWAFDFDLFISLSKIGKIVFLPIVVSKFRWHKDSLSVKRRRESVSEASAVRKANLPTVLRPISELWEWPVRQATYFAGTRVSKRIKNS